MKKPKLLELDIVRGVAIAAVLLIHGTANATVELSPNSRSQTFYETVNQLSYFPVQLFILLSGLVLFYRYTERWTFKTLADFYRKRLQYIVVPYLIWSFGYYLFYKWLDPNIPVTVSIREFAGLLLWGEAGYHLYFMTLIIQFYILFPLLQSLAVWLKPFGKYLWLFGVAFQAVFSVYLYVTQSAVPHGDRLFVTYFALFCIGGSIGLNYERFSAWLNRNIWWVTAAAASVGFIGVLFRASAKFGMLSIPFTYQIHFHLYPVLIFASMAWIGKHLLNTRPRLAAALSSFGAAAFGIYFSHPMLQSLWYKYAYMPPGSLAYHLTLFSCVLLMFVLPWTIVHVLKRMKPSWVLFGK